MPTPKITNKTLAGYLLWVGLDGTPEEIESAYIFIRHKLGLPEKEIESRRINGVQSAMVNEALQDFVKTLKWIMEN